MLCVRNLSKNYDSLEVLKDLNFIVGDEEITALIGPSGCGKTTLLQMIAGMKEIDKGTISGVENEISFVFQEDRLLPWRTVWENISLVMDREDKEEIQNLIDEVGLHGFEHFYPTHLSGGMKKRCGVARAFYHKSNLLLMDEPFTGLDYGLRQEMLSMLFHVWKQRKQSILFITHEIEEALSVANRVLVLSGRPGQIKREFTLPDYEMRRDKKMMGKIRMEIIDVMLEDNKNEYITKFGC